MKSFSRMPKENVLSNRGKSKDGGRDDLAIKKMGPIESAPHEHGVRIRWQFRIQIPASFPVPRPDRWSGRNLCPSYFRCRRHPSRRLFWICTHILNQLPRLPISDSGAEHEPFEKLPVQPKADFPSQVGVGDSGRGIVKGALSNIIDVALAGGAYIAPSIAFAQTVGVEEAGPEVHVGRHRIVHLGCGRNGVNQITVALDVEMIVAAAVVEDHQVTIRVKDDAVGELRWTNWPKPPQVLPATLG